MRIALATTARPQGLDSPTGLLESAARAAARRTGPLQAGRERQQDPPADLDQDWSPVRHEGRPTDREGQRRTCSSTFGRDTANSLRAVWSFGMPEIQQGLSHKPCVGMVTSPGLLDAIECSDK